MPLAERVAVAALLAPKEEMLAVPLAIMTERVVVMEDVMQPLAL